MRNVMTFASRHRSEVEAWFLLHGFVRTDIGWRKPYANDNAMMQYSDNAWIGEIEHSS